MHLAEEAKKKDVRTDLNKSLMAKHLNKSMDDQLLEHMRGLDQDLVKLGPGGKSDGGVRYRGRANSADKTWKRDFEPVGEIFANHARYRLWKNNRSKSVPGKMDKLYKALYGDEKQDAKKYQIRPTTPVKYSFKAGKPKETKLSEQVRGKNQYRTTVIPDYRSLHAQQERELQERRYKNQFITRPEPFVFQARSRKMKPPPEEKHETEDYRWKKAQARRKEKSRGHGFSKPSIHEVEQPKMMPPRNTAKMLQWQQQTAEKLRQDREREQYLKMQEEHYQGKNTQCDPETQQRVKNTVSRMQNEQDLDIERRVYSRRQTQISTAKRWAGDLQRIKERVNARPLLMERTQLEQARERARQRALLRVRATLEEQGVKNLDSHFNNEELDIMDGY